MSAQGKREILALVAGSGLPCRRVLAQLGLPSSTYYRWVKRQVEGRLDDRKGGSPLPWNKIKSRTLEARRDYNRATREQGKSN